MLIGYARVSTDDQHLHLQRDALHQAGCVRIYEDCLSAKAAGYQVGERPVTAAIVHSILSAETDGLEPTLTRHGYDVQILAEQFDAKPKEIRSLLRGQLEPVRARELQDQMLAAGLPF